MKEYGKALRNDAPTPPSHDSGSEEISFKTALQNLTGRRKEMKREYIDSSTKTKEETSPIINRSKHYRLGSDAKPFADPESPEI